VVGSNESPASTAAAHRMGASCACIRPRQPAFREPSAPHSLFFLSPLAVIFLTWLCSPPACWHYNTCSNGPSNQCHSLMPWPNRATIAKAANRVDPKTMVLNSKHLYPSKWCNCSLLSDRPFPEFSRPLSGILHITFLKCVTLN